LVAALRPRQLLQRVQAAKADEYTAHPTLVQPYALILLHVAVLLAAPETQREQYRGRMALVVVLVLFQTGLTKQA